MINKRKKLTHIPGDAGNFIFGHVFQLLKDVLKFHKDRYDRYGPVWKYKIFFEENISLCGPDANEFLLMDRDKIFSSRLGNKYMNFLEGGLLLKDFDEHNMHRKCLQPAFTANSLVNYLPIISKTVEEKISILPSEGRVLFYPFIKKLLLEASATMLMGVDIAEDIEKVNTAFINIVSASASIIRLNIPGTAFHRGKKSRGYLANYLNELIAKKTLQPGDDMLSHLINMRFEDGTKLSNQEIVDHMIFIMAAAHETTMTSVCSVLYALAKYPEWQEKVYQEIVELDLQNQETTMEILGKIQILELVVHECMRLFPPAPGIRRVALKSFDYAGYHIAKGTAVSISISLSNILPEYWSNPHSFDPERFNDARAEHKQHRFLYIPFGGGAYKCMGMKLSQLELKIIITKLLMKYRFNLSDNVEIKPCFGILSPPNTLSLKIEKRKT